MEGFDSPCVAFTGHVRHVYYCFINSIVIFPDLLEGSKKPNQAQIDVCVRKHIFPMLLENINIQTSFF